MTDHADTRLLLLFDIDGTLLQYGGAREHAAALVQALRETYGLELPDDAVTRVGPWGKTDQGIAREVLRAAGVDEGAIDALRDRWIARTWEIFREVDLSRLAGGAMPGAPEALAWATEAGHVTALLTGNIEPIAHRKLDAAGIGSWFTQGQGAFGSDAEDRRELVPVARERAGGWPRERTVVIGDAPGDVACALADKALCVGLLGHFDAQALAGAHGLISGFAELGEAITGLQSR
jgi:phosphoglycolate phosphatase